MTVQQIKQVDIQFPEDEKLARLVQSLRSTQSALNAIITANNAAQLLKPSSDATNELAPGQWEAVVVDDGVAPVLRVRYNRAGSTFTAEVPLV